MSLSAGYTQQAIFTSLSFKLNAGECLHISGGNGVGKSTLLKTIAGLKRAETGTVKLNPFYQCIYIGHDLGLMADLTVADNVAFYDELLDSDENLVAVRERFDLKPIWHKRIRELSRGQQQRVALSRLSMTEPTTVWLLDEPLTGLDQRFQTQFYNLLQWHLNREGIAVIVSHQLNLLVPHEKLRLAA